MNQLFQDFLALSTQERQDVFMAGAEILDTVPTYIEKDFWVCLSLDVLFNGLSNDQPRLLFKGGTSLSKVHGLIHRFSEDIDFTVFREDLGFEEAFHSISSASSTTAKKKKSAEIKEQTSDYIQTQLKAEFARIALAIAPDCTVSMDETDPDHSTILLNYQSVFESEQAPYVQPRVKLEGGGRSALDPHGLHVIHPYIDEVLEDWDFSVKQLRTIRPERTFWDKIMILHGWGCGYRDEQRLPNDPQRLSRHYYDVAMMAQDEIGKKAIKNIDLGNDVRKHAQLFFTRKWMKLEDAIPGSLVISPLGELATSLSQDYQSMQGMMLGTAPPFDEILVEISKVERLINQR